MNCVANFITRSDQIGILPSDLNEKCTAKFYICQNVHYFIIFQFNSMFFISNTFSINLHACESFLPLIGNLVDQKSDAMG